MHPKLAAFTLVLVSVLLTNTCLAHAWKHAETYIVVSPSTEFIARIIPSEKLENPKSDNAYAEIYRLKPDGYAKIVRFRLLNEYAPNAAYLNDDGILVTVRDWGPFNDVDHDVVLYTDRGKVRREFRGIDFFSKSDLEKLQHGDGDILENALSGPKPWVCWQDEPFEFIDHEFVFSDYTGRQIAVDTKSGNFRFYPNRFECK